MEEEKVNDVENKDVNEEKNNNKSSSNSSLKDAVSNVAGSVLDNKYHSRKGPISSNSSNNSKNAPPIKKNNFGNVVKNGIANKVANLHPALRAINNINKIRNMAVQKKPNAINSGTFIDNSQQESRGNDSSDTNTSGDSATSIDSSNEDDKDTSFNPLGSFSKSKNGFLGRFSFLGKFSLPVKLVILLGIPLFGLLFILIVLFLPFASFSGLLGTDEGLASESSGTGNIDYGDYQLSSDGHEILHEPLDTFLESKGTSLEEFNNLIASNVEKAGSGTRAGVVAAAVTLIAELGNNYGVKIPYYWTGGHGHIATGAEASWGSGRCYTTANGQAYTYCGLDCSGFVTWALNNGGLSVPVQSANTFVYLDGAKRVSLGSSAVLQAGDLLATSGHIILIVGVDDSGYICAEAAGNETGVLFSRKSFNASSYYGIDMSGFYGG